MGVVGLEKLIQCERMKLQCLENEVNGIAAGKLHINKKGNKCYFKEYNNGKQYGISKNLERVYALARKDVLKNKMSEVRRTLEILEWAEEKLSKCRETTRYRETLEKYEMLDKEKLIYSKEERAWLFNKASQNPFKRESLRYKTSGGVITRSKSERFIGEFLEARGLIYRYEPEVVIDGRPVYPDFMVLCPNGKTVLWEHCGLMDNAEYFSRTMVKLHEYRKIGYAQNNNLICTYEEDLLSGEYLEDITYRFIYL